MLWVVRKIHALEEHMSELDDAVAAEEQAIQDLRDRVAAIDVSALQAALDNANQALADLQATDDADKAALAAAQQALADAQADVSENVAKIQTQVTELQGIAQPPTP